MKNRKRTVERIIQLAEPVCRSEGLELVHVEYQHEPGGKILRVYIDRNEGVSLDDCVNISRQLNDLLDVHLETGSPYRLEVSSPGSNRPLGKPADFDRFKGQTARIKTASPVYGRKNFKGVLKGTVETNVLLAIEKDTIQIPLDSIVKARLVNYNGEN